MHVRQRHEIFENQFTKNYQLKPIDIRLGEYEEKREVNHQKNIYSKDFVKI